MLPRPLALLLVGAFAGACAGAPPPAPVDTGVCKPDHLDVCERRLALAPDRDLVRSYLAARAARDPADPWARLARDLGETLPPGPVVLAEPGAAPVQTKLPTLAIAALPAPAAIRADDLLLAVADAARRPVVLRTRGAAVTAFFPGDPLAPFVPGLRPLLAVDPARVDAEAGAGALVREAIEAAGRSDYLEAARKADEIAAALGSLAPASPSAARARYAHQLLSAAGIALEPRAPLPPLGDWPLVAGETPYAAYLHVVTAKDPRRAWETLGPRVLDDVGQDRRDDVAALFTRTGACDARRPPPMEGARDLVFAQRLSAALTHDPTPRPGELAFADWSARTRTMADLVARTHAAWSYLPALLAERGESFGLSAEGSALYAQVSSMAEAHLAASRKLEASDPARYRATSLLALGLAPGLLADPPLQKALTELTEAAVTDRLAAAHGPDAILSAVAAGVLAGLSYPPSLQEAHLGALRTAVTAKLEGELSLESGWDVAALYAADAAYRLLSETAPKLDFSSRQITRALSAQGVPHPALAALAAAAARYVALGAAKKLDPGITREDRIPPERKAARADLRRAFAGLGAPGEAPESALDDLTTFTDGLVAALSTALAAKKPPRARAKQAEACAQSSAITLDPGTRRALARLGDVRGRLLHNPRLAKGDGLFARRARLVVTLLSDAMDLAVASDTRKPPVFAVSAKDAERAWKGALAEVETAGVADSAASGHALLRTFAASATLEAFAKQGSRDLRRLAGGLLTLFGGSGMSGALLQALAGDAVTRDPGAALVAYADTLYAAGRDDQADLCLLAAIVTSKVTRATLPAEAASLAEQHRSRLAWALRFLGELGRPTPDPAVYADGLRRATDDACQAPDAEATIAVARAVRDFAAGRRAEARAALDQVLARADERGLGVPRMAYRYEEKTATRVFQVDFEISYGSGFLISGNTYKLGLRMKSEGEPGGSLTATLLPAGSAHAGEDAARYYVYVAALAATYHLVGGDPERAVAAARRAIGALSSGLVLGPRRLRSDKPASWGEDAREVLLVAGQLAAEANMPFLAGDLFTVARQGFSEATDDRAVAAMLDRPPLGLAGIPELGPVMDRARRSLHVLADPLPCTKAKIELGAYEEVGCDAYPLALSLRIADALKKLPRLRRSPETTARCPSLKSLDAFLGAAEKSKSYDPDAFTRAVEDLRAAGKADDAAVLLARQKHPSHCSPPIVSAARALGRSAPLGPALRADLLSAAVNCTAAAGGAEVVADVLALDEETRRLPDPARNLQVVLSVADLAARADRWETLGKLVDRPDFTARWMSVSPNAAAAALLLQHAVSAARGEGADGERAKGEVHLLCEAFPAKARAEVCGLIAGLRALGSPDERKKAAREAVRKLCAGMSGQAAKVRPGG